MSDTRLATLETSALASLPAELLLVELPPHLTFYSMLALLLANKQFASYAPTFWKAKGRELFGDEYMTRYEPQIENEKKREPFNEGVFWKEKLHQRISYTHRSVWWLQDLHGPIEKIVFSIMENDIPALNELSKKSQAFIELFPYVQFNNKMIDALIANAKQETKQFIFDKMIAPYFVPQLERKSLLQWKLLCGQKIDGKMFLNNYDLCKQADVNGRTFLHDAAELGYAEYVRKLLSGISNPSTHINTSKSPLVLAASSGHVNVVKTILSLCNSIQSEVLDRAYLHAIEANHVSVLRKLSQYPGFIIPPEALHHAIDAASMDALEYLIKEKKVNVDYHLNYTIPALHLAAMKATKTGSFDILDAFLSYPKKNINIPLGDKSTALHSAIWSIQPNKLNFAITVCQKLLAAGIDRDISDNFGRTALKLLDSRISENTCKDEHTSELLKTLRDILSNNVSDKSKFRR